VTRKLISIVLLLSCITLHATADWTIFTYIEGSHGLQHEAITNLSQMALGKVPDNVNMIVQVHTGGTHSFIYEVKQNNIMLLDRVACLANAKNNIINTMKMVVTAYPATHYGLITWDNGYGILLPYYDKDADDWDILPEDPGICSTCLAPLQKTHKKRTLKTKGMLVNAHTKTVMGNEDMVEMTRVISQDLLGGKKLDFLGIDCCLGAMLEHGYQVRQYTKYLIGSQDCELTDGFDYVNLMLHFQQGHVTPKQIAIDIVDDYGAYNKKLAEIGRYTMSAFDLSYMDTIKENIDAISKCMLALLEKDRATFKKVIMDTRKECLRFCMTPVYMDIYDFYKTLYSKLTPFDSDNLVQQLKNYIIKGQNLIKKAVIANATGPVNKKAQGISIYFPFVKIDASYPPTTFAKDSHWFILLKELLK